MDIINWFEETNIWIPMLAFLLFKVYSCKKGCDKKKAPKKKAVKKKK